MNQINTFMLITTGINLLLLFVNAYLAVMQWKLIKAKTALIDRKFALLERKEQANAG